MNVLLIKDKNGNFIHIPAIRGKSFTYDDFTEEQLNGLRGKDGKDGQDYVLTEGDKREIAEIALSLIPTTEGVKYG